ncbi:hypothetical protein [Marinitenerispora sediminis]|uniref:Uncharacterized protein n=1 Tax=Marinitenerispora sediminis TaxID=1931232 RepID=A0A368TBX5_9ACTN|nr:hypothetical protein [Marinitenerispora sediminis]RCV56664.1 hypothetical protein DEF28_03025 [Marinitenerispora sediminis]RCV61656.1 hypothetical protein DEF23_01735 [Marinitenerispora sediminis]RCV62612.1 hypothetical protein DEF24_00055 [Marinitenerispora sediminis]
MARRIRVIGSTSDDGNCPTLYEDVDTGEVIVQGYTVNDPEDLTQFQHVLDGESFVVVPRELLTRFPLKD